MDGTANQDQAAFWNERAGRTWSELQPLLDRTFAPLLPILVEPLAAGAGGAVLDVGCGAGALTFAAVDRLGADARCLGVDISAPLVAAAEARAAAVGSRNVAFRVADAQTHLFERGGFDHVLSRFGVMFFDDPEAAFANLRLATRDGGSLRFVAWRDPAENPFMRAAKPAVSPEVEFPAHVPDAPGQFGFADGERTQRLLTAAGWRDVALAPIDVTCRFPASDLLTFATRMGPLGGLWPELAPDVQDRLRERLSAAFTPFVQGPEVVFTAACWLATATA